MRSDIDRWNAKYGKRAPSPSIEPDPLLLEYHDLFEYQGLCVDLAGGTGDNGLFLCQLGYHSIIVDGSEAGLRLCRYKAKENGLDPMLVVADLDRFTLPPSTFDAVLVFRYLNRRLVKPIRRSLKAGGVLFFKTFNTRHAVDHPGFPKEYMLADGELTRWFSDLHCVLCDDGNGVGTTYYWVGYK